MLLWLSPLIAKVKSGIAEKRFVEFLATVLLNKVQFFKQICTFTEGQEGTLSKISDECLYYNMEKKSA
jgi:hypothetical protein